MLSNWIILIALDFLNSLNYVLLRVSQVKKIKKKEEAQNGWKDPLSEVTCKSSVIFFFVEHALRHP